MAEKYVINWTDESLKAAFYVDPNTTDERTTSLTLVGAGALEWGSEYQENFLHLLENFASNNKPPLSPTVGQTWFNAGTGHLSIFSTDQQWMDLKSRRIDANKEPIGHFVAGDLWFDTGRNQLKVYLSDGTWSDPMSGTRVSRPGGVPTPTPQVTPTPATPTAPTPLPPGVTPTPTVTPVTPTPGISVEPPFPATVFPYGQPSNLYPTMTLNENFNGTSLDANKWNVGLWYDGNNNLNNYAVENGTLIAWPKKTAQGTWDPHNFTITTDGKFYQKYGYFEAKIKLPYGSAMCPTFWLYAHNDSTRPDITALASFPGAVGIYSDSNLHPHTYTASVTDGAVNKLGERKLLGSLYNDLAAAPDLSTDFHIYGVRWDASGVQFYFDGQALGSKIGTSTMSQKMFLVLDLWLGGDSGAPDSTTPTVKDRGMVVDYVRAWALNDGSTQVSGTYTVPPPTLPVPTPTAVPTVPTPVPPQSATDLTAVQKVTGLAKPWAMAFLSTTKVLVTEKTGPTMRIVNPLNGSKSAPLTGLPSILVTKHGGLLDVILDSSFDATRVIYFSYTAGTATANAITVSKARLSNDETALENVTQIFQADPLVNSGDQPGGRLVERPDGTLMLTSGDRYVMDTQAQVLTNHFGKVVRFKKDGTVPSDNPYANAANADQKYVYSYGHRNPLGAINGPDGNLWINENMAQGGDEINIIKPGLNYGWPIQSYGSHYADGHNPQDIPDTAPGVELPIYYWNPSIAPSGMCLLDSNIYGPDWKGNLFLGALAGTSVRRFSINGLKNDVVQEFIYLQNLAKRIRDVRQGPDGYLYVCTDEDAGSIYQLQPVFPAVPAPTPVGTPTPTVTPGGVLPFGQSGNYTLTFSDEFNSGLDFTKWNDHIWYEQSNPLINYKVQNGSLFVWPDSGFVNRTIDTDGKFSQTYGFYEIEAKLPTGAGCWPAFWLYAHPDNGNKSRPELDIMEAYPGGGPSSGWGDSNLHPTNYGLTIHMANANYSYHEVPYSKKLSDFGISADLSAGYHKYGMKWEADGVTFYFDGQQLGSKWMDTTHYFDQPMYVLLDLWFGSASGQPGAGTPTGINNSYEIRYVRVWSFSGATSPVPVPTPVPTVTPTPTPTVAPTPTGPLVIDYYGDSTIWGVNGAGGGRVATPQPQVFSNSLASGTPAFSNTTRNEGVSSTNSTQLLNGTDGVHPVWTTQMANSNAKYVIINHGINDWMNNATVYKSNLQQLTTVARNAGKVVLFQTPNPTYQTLSGGSTASDAEVANKAQYMRELGFSLSVPVIDVHKYITDYAAANNVTIQSLILDGLHPNQSTYNLIGVYASNEFKRLLGLSSTVPTPSPSPTILAGGSSGVVTAPSIASSAGFNNRVFFDDFNDPSTIGPNGTKWWTKRPFYPDMQPSEYSVANSILSMKQGTNYSNFGLCTVGPGGVGFAKRNGGYFEARIRILGRGRSGGWTSFWTMSVEHLYGNITNYIEVDFLEDLGGAFGWPSTSICSVVHDWTNQTVNNSSSPNQITVPSGFNFSDWHVYGCLWKPGNRITFYLDGVQTVNVTNTSLFAAGDSTGWPIILGTGNGANFDVDWVSVWG